jgi:Holliday junction resolvasome RuvABC endonuclease subunit
MRILALDLATKCGWAHSSGDSGTWKLAAKMDDSIGMRLLYLRQNLHDIFVTHGIDLVVFEAVRYGGSDAQRAMIVQSELQGVMKAWCEDMGINYTSYSSNEIKKHATDNGNAKKRMMIDAAISKWKRAFSDEDDNEVDALWLLDLASKDFYASDSTR